MGDANKDGNIDLEEWLDVMNDIIIHLKENGKFPEWYEGLHKALFRSNEFYGKLICEIFSYSRKINKSILMEILDDRDVLKDEFVIMMSAWSIDEEAGMFDCFISF